MSSSKPLLTYQRRSKSKSIPQGGVVLTPTIPRVPRSRPSPSVSMGDTSMSVPYEAASSFRDVVANRNFVAERSYLIDALSSEVWCAASQIFEHYHLKTLNTLSSKFNASVVKEFYSNIPVDLKGFRYSVSVRSTRIVLKPSVICRVLGFQPCPDMAYEKFCVASSQYSVALFRQMAYTDPSLPLTSKGLPIKSYLTPFFKFLWDFIRHNVLPTGNNSNPTLAGCRIMLSMVNRDMIPFGDIIFHAILGKSVSHGTKHKGTLVFPCFLHRLCEIGKVAFQATDQWIPPLAPYSQASVSLSQKVSNTFLTKVSSASDSASLRTLLAEKETQLAEKEKHIQHLLTLVPSTHAHDYATPSSATAAALPADPAVPEDLGEDSDDSAGSLVF